MDENITTPYNNMPGVYESKWLPVQDKIPQVIFMII
jgi:hypothetical protein